MPFLSNTHDESDTRVIFFCSAYSDLDCVIKSTDSDILFNALLNHDNLSMLGQPEGDSSIREKGVLLAQ